MEKVININGIDKKYGQTVALTDISFSVNKGELFGLIGPDGAGKSSLFRILATLLLPDKGQAEIEGLDTRKDYRQIRSQIGYMPGRFSLYPDLSVEENLTFFANIHHVKVETNYAFIQPIFQSLEQFRKRRAGALSGGMKQKLALCCALIHKPSVLLLDEPTTGVDPVSRQDFWNILRSLKLQGITLLVSTPIMDEARQCDRMAFIHEGTIRGIGEPTNVIMQFRDILCPDGLERQEHNEKPQYAIEVEGLTKKFGDFTAVNHISFNVHKGEIFGFLGANGAGKTTAMRILCGLSKPTGGDGRIAGLDIHTESELIKRRIGYMSQRFSLYEELTVEENIRLFAGIYGMKTEHIIRQIPEILQRIHLENERKTLVKRLPLGWKQRIAFAVATFHQPDIVFLDEPTGGVDPGTRRRFWEMIYKEADRGTTIFVTTHYMDEAAYCDRVSIMVDGAIKALDTPEQLKKTYQVTSMDEVFKKLVRPETISKC